MSVTVAPRVPVPSEVGKTAISNQQEAEDDGRPRITKKVLEAICKELKLYRTPHLNDKLYLHFKGFSKIENLEEYTGVKALWLESNSITKIEGLDALTELRCLYLHQNGIDRIENLHCLHNLTNLNLSNNCLRHIDNLSCLPSLSQVQLSDNQIETYEHVAHLGKCKTLNVIDLKNNKLNDPKIVEIFKQIPDLRVLVLMGNPVVKKIKSYRKTLITEIESLTYIDERPVFEDDKRTAAAWLKGGIEAERAERIRIKDEKHEKQMASIHALAAKRKEWARQGRIERGEDREADHESSEAKDSAVPEPCVPPLHNKADEDDEGPGVEEIEDTDEMESQVANTSDVAFEDTEVKAVSNAVREVFVEPAGSKENATSDEGATYEAPNLDEIDLDIEDVEPMWGSRWGMDIPKDEYLKPAPLKCAPPPKQTPVKTGTGLHAELEARAAANKKQTSYADPTVSSLKKSVMASRSLMAQAEGGRIKKPLIQMLDPDDSDDE